MFCDNCGAQNKDNAKFCRKCGVAMKTPADGNQSPGGAGRKKPIFVVGVCIAVAVACIVGIVIYRNGQKDAEYNEAIREAQQYVEDLNYEKAETAYLDAIDIEPKRAEAYLELSDVYIVQEEYEEALAILEKGQNKTNNIESFEKKIKSVKEQAKADPKSAQYQAYYDLVMEYQDKYGEAGYLQWNDEDGFGYLTGLCIVKLFDFNKDGNEELILGYSKENTVEVVENNKYEVWAWQDGETANILPATKMNHGNGISGWINTAVKDETIFLEVDSWDYDESTLYEFHKKYLQYDVNKFIEKYTYSGTEYKQPPQFSVNGTIVYSYEEAKKLMEDLPKNSSTYDSGNTFFEENDGKLWIDIIGGYEYMRSVLTETDRNINLLKDRLETEADDDNSRREAEVLKNLPDFYFSSGVGAWGTNLRINEDGTFTGDYHDSEMGGIGEGHPNGTRYICNFSGSFTDMKQIDEYTWSMKLDELKMENTLGEEWIEDGIKHIAAEPYGIEGGETFYLYLPGIPIDSLPEEYLSWGIGTFEDDATLQSHGLYNVDVKCGFFS